MDHVPVFPIEGNWSLAARLHSVIIGALGDHLIRVADDWSDGKITDDRLTGLLEEIGHELSRQADRLQTLSTNLVGVVLAPGSHRST
jgi:hypothetical protein